MTPLLAPCLPCSGTGATGSGPCSDGFRHVHPCDACHGAGEVLVRCPCGAPAVHELPILGALCASCAPHGCGTCATFGVSCCLKHLPREHPAFVHAVKAGACDARAVADDDLAYVCQLAHGHRGAHRHQSLLWGHSDLVWTVAS